MIKGIENANFKNKKVIIRCDLNVPMKDGKIQDNTRIIESLKTIRYVNKTASKIIILSHLGRIKTEEDINKNSLKPICDNLEKLLNEKIVFATYNENLEEIVSKNRIIMFENTRFFDLDGRKESTNDKDLSEFFASFGDIFINDAFGTCHRLNSSNVGIQNYLPSYNGFLVEKEVKLLDKVLNPKKPLIVIMGGAKVFDKIKLIEKLLKISDKIIVTGGMAFTFLKAKGYEIGKSIVDEESIHFCKKVLKEHEDKIILPRDFYTGLEFENSTTKNLRKVSEIQKEEIGLDIGPKTVKMYQSELNNAETIFWNGPVGVFEFDNFSYGTIRICEILNNINDKVIIGGGDSVSAINKFNFKFKNVSTGGGAALEYIEGKKLPGLIFR